VTAEEHEADDAARAEQPLSDLGESLYRQVHPTWVVDGVPSSQAFRPTKKDEGMLSIALGSRTTPEGAFLHHTQALKLGSAGSWAVTVAETKDARLDSYTQPLPESPDHGFIDFRGLARGQVEVRAKLLLSKAHIRGRLYPPSS
jgi:hypothetical protein